MALHRHDRGVLKDRKGQRDGLQKLQRMKTGLIFKAECPLHRKGKFCLDHLQSGKARLPTHISVAPLSCGLPKESVILLEQVRTLDKRRLREKMGRLDDGVMKQVDAAIAVSFGLHPETMV